MAIISVWACEANGTIGLMSDEAEATVTHTWQAEFLAAACAKRYKSNYAVVYNGEPTQVYNARGMCMPIRKAKG